MKISLKRLKNKMVSVRAVLLTKTEANDPYSNEIWLKFKDDTFVFISFEHLIVGALDNIKLGGRGDLLPCTDEKKIDLNQIGPYKSTIINELEDAKNLKSNLEETIDVIIDLFENVENVIK